MSSRSSFVIESLEDRRLLSISAATLAGPLTKGTTWTYKSSSGAVTVNKVVGTVMVGKVPCTQINIGSATGSVATTIQDFVRLSSAGLFIYKIKSLTSMPSFTATSVHTFFPFETIYPPSLTAKKVYSFAWSETIDSTSSAGSQEQQNTQAYSVQLVSDKTTKIKVPAGTFNVYTIKETLKTTSHGVTTTTSFTHFVAAGVGDVKIVNSSGATTVLTKFVKK